MTSTSFNVGLTNSKNSSKVIKPPGGGHTDIFGIYSNTTDIITPNKKRIAPHTTISSCFVEEEKNDTKKLHSTDNTDHTNGNSSQDDKKTIDVDITLKNEQNGTNDNMNPKSEEKIETPRRQRVPPGGFSSRLW